jgi:co-chaperonin GroES (HSP10)
MAEETKTFGEIVRSQLEKSKSQMEEIEALAKGSVSQAVNDTINGLKSKRQEIVNKFQGLKTSADTKAKAEIVADLDKFNVVLGQVATKLKSHTASK